MYSFITTHRNRDELLNEFRAMIHQQYPNDELIVVEQWNDLPFMQGQLYNLAVPHSTGEIVILMDVDMRFTIPVDFKHHMQRLQRPFIGYDRIINVDGNGKEQGIREFSHASHGGCCVFTRKQWELSCGFSNLMCWWGGEDDILNQRVGGYARISNMLHHITHERSINGHHYDINVKMYHSDSKRKKELDGYKQTVGNLVRNERVGNDLYLAYDRISVVPDFQYRDLLRDILKGQA
jgi:hypothetical protein